MVKLLQELLALEERIGNVNTGLSEDIIQKCAKAINFASLNEASTVICLESEVKCSICQVSSMLTLDIIK